MKIIIIIGIIILLNGINVLEIGKPWLKRLNELWKRNDYKKDG